MRTDQARALGDPTRAALFRAVVDADEPLPVSTLAARVGLHANAVRPQLARLVAVGLLEELVDPIRRRGRPRHLYRPAPGAAESGSAGEGPYERLSLLLLEVLGTGATPEEVGAAHGRALARRARTADDPVAALEHELAVQGFGPRRVPTTEGSETIVLGTCPFGEAVRVAPEVICDLHLGLCRGVAEAVGGLRVTGLEPADPMVAGCRVHLAVDSTGSPSGRRPSTAATT
ncbi:MAG: helix-turn-helix domain-containing protein [Acidimicrobiales bacterium]